jgi:hypothetical protein
MNSLQDNEPVSAAWAASLLIHGEAWVARPVECVETTAKTTLGPITWLGVGCSEDKAE